MKTISLHSPKNKFRCEINYKNALKEIGSVESFTANSLEDVKNEITQMGSNISKAKGAYITVFENKAVYPKFDWKVIERLEK